MPSEPACLVHVGEGPSLGHILMNKAAACTNLLLGKICDLGARFQRNPSEIHRDIAGVQKVEVFKRFRKLQKTSR
jgi:hypothetical protein